MSTFTRHAADRAAERLGPIPPDVRAAIIRTAAEHADTCRVRTAVRCATLPAPIGGAAWSDVSNGDVVWAIVAPGRVVTFMLRRRTQSATCEGFRVDVIIDPTAPAWARRAAERRLPGRVTYR